MENRQLNFKSILNAASYLPLLVISLQNPHSHLWQLDIKYSYAVII